MALFGKKKKEKAAEEAAAIKNATETASDEGKSELDMIKEVMEEAKQERHTEAVTTAPAPAGENDMPTPEEIRKAQEILARAQAGQQAPAGARVGANAPVNMASLKAVVNNFIQSKTQDNMKKVMECLQNPQTLVCVPAQIITSKENQEKMKQGGEVKLEGPIKINPVIFTDNTGKKLFPIFAGEDSIPDEIKSKTPKVNMPFGQCVHIINTLPDVNTFVLEPYTANIRIGINANDNKKA